MKEQLKNMTKKYKQTVSVDTQAIERMKKQREAAKQVSREIQTEKG